MSNKLISLSQHFGISPKKFEELELLDPTVNSDVNLFIDPLLLKSSKHNIFKNDARKKYEEFFIDLRKKAHFISKLPEDRKEKAISNIVNSICAREPAGVCLGYSKSSNKGSGVGPNSAEKIIRSAVSTMELGVEDPAIFSVFHLLEDKIGPDYISDLTVKIINKELCLFTQDMSEKLNIPQTETVLIDSEIYKLPKHPFLNVPIYLLPKDILSDLPIEINFCKVLGSYSRTSTEIRTAINEDIANIYSSSAISSQSDVKKYLRDYVYDKPQAMAELINHLFTLEPESYDFSKDKKGITLSAIFEDILDLSPYKIQLEKHKLKIIEELIDDFKNLLDNNNDIKRSLLWTDGTHKNESAWQSAFHLFVSRILHRNKIDLNPEFQTGSGPVDFKFSYTSSFRVLIEMKLSSNPNYLSGFTKQTEKYKECTEDIRKAFFIFINVEKEEKKWKEKVDKLLQCKEELNIDTEIIIIDGRINPSASNL